jgi:hypothetical protein
MKTIATAIYVRTESGDGYLFCEEDGFTAEGLIKFLRDALYTEYAWIANFDIVALNWDEDTLDINAVWEDIQKELDKQ